MPNNCTLRDILADEEIGRPHKVLMVMDEALCNAQPGLIGQIFAYFEQFNDCLKLVCDPMQFEGGERTKNSYFHVSEIHSKVEMHHIDRHSYVIAVGGGALLDMAGLASSTAPVSYTHLTLPTKRIV